VFKPCPEKSTLSWDKGPDRHDWLYLCSVTRFKSRPFTPVQACIQTSVAMRPVHPSRLWEKKRSESV